MATLNQDVDYFLIGLTNYSGDGYAKNSAQKVGGYQRTIYCWEILFDVDLSSIPAGSTIDSVTIDVNVTANTAGGAGAPLRVHEQDKASWTDNASTVPAWGQNPNNSSTANWPAHLSTTSNFTNTGLKTIPTSANLVSWFQTELDSGHTNNGLIISYYTGAWQYYATVDDVDISVEYTESSGTRRVMVVS